VRVGVGLAVNVVDELTLMLTEDDPVLVIYTETDDDVETDVETDAETDIDTETDTDVDAETDIDSDPDIVGIFPPNTCADTRGVADTNDEPDNEPEYEMCPELLTDGNGDGLIVLIGLPLTDGSGDVLALVVDEGIVDGVDVNIDE